MSKDQTHREILPVKITDTVESYLKLLIQTIRKSADGKVTSKFYVVVDGKQKIISIDASLLDITIPPNTTVN